MKLLGDSEDPKSQALDLVADDEEFDEPLVGNDPTVWVERTQRVIRNFHRKNKKLVSRCVWLTVLSIWHIYIARAMWLDSGRASTMFGWTVVAWMFFVYYKVITPYVFPRPFCQWIYAEAEEKFTKIGAHPATTPACYILTIASAFGYVIADNISNNYPMTFDRFMSCAGIFIFLGILTLCSKQPSKIKWRPVIWGFMFQFWIGIILLRWEYGRRKMIDIADVIVKLLTYTYPGSEFVFSFNTNPPNICGMPPALAFKALTCIIFTNALIFISYYYGWIQALLKWLTWFVQHSCATSATESLIAVSSIYGGLTDVPMLIKAYLDKMTISELNAIMTACFASIAGSIMPIFIDFGACPEYILAASAMSGPGSLASSKILVPETEQSYCVRAEDLEFEATEEANVMETVTNASIVGSRIWLEVSCVCITFVGLMFFVNGITMYLGELIGYEGYTLDMLLGYIFVPVSWIMGITDPDESLIVGRLIAVKIMSSELVSFERLGHLQTAGLLSARSTMIATYAMCGFSNFLCCGITMSVLKALAPSRNREIVSAVFYSLLGGCVVSFITACISGVLIVEPRLCPPANMNAGCFNVTKAGALLDRFEQILANASSVHPLQALAGPAADLQMQITATGLR